MLAEVNRAEETSHDIGEFPYDVVYLDASSLGHIQDLTGGKNDIWNSERLQAYQGQDMLAKRAAVSSFLWQRYQEMPTMSVAMLKLWVEIERDDQILRPQPWFFNHHRKRSQAEIQQDWRAFIGEQRMKETEAKHRQVMEQIQQML
jgi:hypothetical protein